MARLATALPRLSPLGMEGLLLLAPAEPYVCIGYHQDAEQEVDLDFCREQSIPVFRREVGGGAVYLDGQQLFYQLVLHRDDSRAPRDKQAFYETLLEPVVQTYRDLGVKARFRPVNDIVTAEGRKISGNGAAEIGDYAILVGNLIADFDYQTMSRVLRVPDAKFRDKVFKSLHENLTTLARELEQAPSWETMTSTLARNFETVLGPLTPAVLPQSVRDEAAALAPSRTSDGWLLKAGRRLRAGSGDSLEHTRRKPGRAVKIAEGIGVVQQMHKAPGGLIRATVEVHHGRITGVEISGDFFFYPAEGLADLEQHLVGTRIPDVVESIKEFYRRAGIESPGVTPNDLAKALGAE